MEGGAPVDIRRINLKDESVRLATFTNWPVTFISPTSLAKAGFYYLGTDDAVKCVYCSGIIAQWEDQDDPKVEHQKFFPQCPKVLSDQGITIQEDTGIETRKPKSLAFATLESRIRSFANWKYEHIQDGEELAKAGFYYLGIHDEVRCFYCDGGLRFWQAEDDPFYEHARYFEKCGFVRLTKGKAYVDNVLREVLEKQSVAQSRVAEATQPSQTTATIEDAMNSEPVKQALQLGLDIGRIRMVSQRKINMTGSIYTTVEELIGEVLDGQINEEGLTDRQLENQVNRLLLSAVSSVQLNSEDMNQPSTSKCKTPTVPEAPPKPTEMQQIDTDDPTLKLEEENKKLKRSRECKICMSADVEIVFLPCGHLLSCVSCSCALTDCPLCRTEIKGKIRTFWS